MKRKLKLKWHVDLLPGIKICKPSPVSVQKQAELGKQVPLHVEIFKVVTIGHSVTSTVYEQTQMLVTM